MPDWIFCDCPHCGNTLRLDSRKSEEATTCPACKRRVTPAEAMAAALPAQDSPSTIDPEAAVPGNQVSRKLRRRRMPSQPTQQEEPQDEAMVVESPEPDDSSAHFLPVGGDSVRVERAAAYFDELESDTPVEPVEREKLRKVDWTEDEEISLGRGFAEEFESSANRYDEDADDDGEPEFDEDGNPIPKKRGKGRKRRFGLWWDNLDWENLEPRALGRDKANKRLIQAGYLVLALGCVIVGIVMFSSRGRTGVGDGTDGSQSKRPTLLVPGQELPVLPKAESELVLREALATRPKEIIDTIRPTVEKFLSSPKWNDRLLLARDPERVRPLMEKYHSTNPDAPYAFLHVGMDGNISYRENLMVLNVVMKDYSQKEIAIAYENGRFLIDWESFVGYGDFAAAQMKDVRPTTPFLMRAGISPSLPPYFNYAFTDEANLNCYVLSFPDDSYVFGYVEKLSPVANRIAQLLGNSPSVLMTLNLRYPEGAVVGDQVWIEDVLAEGWVLVEPEEKSKP